MRELSQVFSEFAEENEICMINVQIIGVGPSILEAIQQIIVIPVKFR